MVRIVDASVALKWFVSESGHEPAKVVLRELIDTPRAFAVPELFYFELTHVFHRILPRATPEQIALLEVVLELPIQRFVMTRELLALTREFQGLGLSGYDGSYVALAKMLQGVWLTFDSRAHKMVRPGQLSKLLR